MNLIEEVVKHLLDCQACVECSTLCCALSERTQGYFYLLDSPLTPGNVSLLIYRKADSRLRMRGNSSTVRLVIIIIIGFTRIIVHTFHTKKIELQIYLLKISKFNFTQYCCVCICVM